jgi:hypothetical protein
LFLEGSEVPRHQNRKTHAIVDHQFVHIEYVDGPTIARRRADGSVVMQCMHCHGVDEAAGCIADHQHEFLNVQYSMESGSDDDSASITAGDMRANVGIAYAEARIKAARKKIRNWALPSDDIRAVTVVPREGLALFGRKHFVAGQA